MEGIDRLIGSARDVDKLSTACLISLVERGDTAAPYILEKIWPPTGNACYIGIAEPPGAGKSTMVDRLVSRFCRNQYPVGVTAADRTGPFSGAALFNLF